MFALLVAPLLVPLATTNPVFLSSAQVKHSGVHLGDGVFLGANHNPKPGGAVSARLAQGLNAQGDRVKAREYDFTLPEDTSLWKPYGASPDRKAIIRPAYDMALEVAEPIAGAAARMAIFSDPADIHGPAINVGFPVVNPLTGKKQAKQDRKMFYAESTIAPGSYRAHELGGGVIRLHTWATKGMSGGGLFLRMDPDGDGVPEWGLIGLTTRATMATALGPHYPALAEVLQELGRDADAFPRPALIAAQRVGSKQTTVTGTYLNEDLYGGPNADTLAGGGGDDRLFGGAGGDRFVFAPGGGVDEVQDFVPAQDMLDIQALAQHSFDFQAEGADVRVSYGTSGDQILFRNADLEAIRAAFTGTN